MAGLVLVALAPTTVHCAPSIVPLRTAQMMDPPSTSDPAPTEPARTEPTDLATLARVKSTGPIGGAGLRRDLVLHLGVSAALAVTGYLAGRMWLKDRPRSAALGAGLAVTAGVSKELVDLTGFGDPSWEDLGFDLLGTATGIAFTIPIDLTLFPSSP